MAHWTVVYLTVLLLYEVFATHKHVFPLCSTIVEYSWGALILSYIVLFVNNILTYSLGFGINMCRTDYSNLCGVSFCPYKQMQYYFKQNNIGDGFLWPTLYVMDALHGTESWRLLEPCLVYSPSDSDLTQCSLLIIVAWSHVPVNLTS